MTTPRTEAQIAQMVYRGEIEWIPANFARQLETELAAAREKLSACYAAMYYAAAASSKSDPTVSSALRRRLAELFPTEPQPNDAAKPVSNPS